MYKMSILGTQKVLWNSRKDASINGFVCKRCPGLVATSMEEIIMLDEDNMEIVDKFVCLGDVLGTEGGAQEVLRSTAQMAEWYGASVSRAVDSGLIPSRVKPMT